MGHKVNPQAFRLGYLYTSPSRWYSKYKYADLVKADSLIRDLIMKTWKEALVEKVEIERGGKTLEISVVVAKPGVAIGRGGAGAEELKKKLAALAGVLPQQMTLNIRESDNSAISSSVIVQQMATDLEKRMAFRRVMKNTIEKIMKAGALGVKVTISGRLNGAEIARTETLSQGKVPLHTLRADVDFARGTAFTTYGAIGLKLWIYKGEIFN